MLVSGRNTGESTLVLSGTLQDIHGILDDGVNLGIILLHVALRKLEEFALGMLHQFVNIHALVVRLSLYIAGIMNKLSLQILLRQDSGMILYVGSRSHLRRNLHQVSRPSHFLYFAHLGELIDDGHDIHRSLLHVHGLDGLVYFLVSRIIESGRFQHF